MDPSALYAAIVESTDDAVIAKSLDGTILSWNPAATRILGWTAEDMVGQSIRKIIPPERQAEEDGILARVHRGERVEKFETERLRKDGSLADLAIQVSPVRDATGKVVGASKIARDITEELRARRQREAEAQFFALVGDNLPVFAWLSNRDRALVWANRLFRDAFGLEIDGYAKFNWPDHVPADLRPAAVGGISAAIEKEQPWEGVIPIRRGDDDPVRWILVRSNPVRDRHGENSLRFATGTDITEQRNSEERTRTLLKEVNHRTRNMLAMIQSMAKRTAASGGDFVPRLECRIAGLAATQDLLVGHDWDGVPLDALIHAQLKVADQAASRVALSGPAVQFAPGAAESVGMAINELAINAERYGALSVPEGGIELGWELTGSGDDEVFTLDWLEHGGPAVSAPEVSGFGSKIIEDVPRGKLCGAVEISYAPAGFHWRLTCPARLALAGRDSA